MLRRRISEAAFNLAVHRLRGLGKLPILPVLFESGCSAWNGLLDREKVEWLSRIERSAAAWEGVTMSWHRFGGLQFDVAGREIGHLHGVGLVDVLLDRDSKREAISALGAVDHHVLPPGSPWVSLWVREPTDVGRAVGLLRIGYELRRQRRFSPDGV